MNILYVLSITFFIFAVLPECKSKYWLVRAFDFPRIQILFINSVLLILNLICYIELNYINITLSFLAVVFDLYRVVPYTFLFPKEVPYSKGLKPSLKLLCANILIENKDYNKAFEVIENLDPDLVLLLETDYNWEQACTILKNKYMYHVLKPQENGFGMLLYSKYEILNPELKFLIDERIPSLFFSIHFDNQNVKVIALHPRPPGLIKSSSTQRDTELKKTAKWINENSGTETIVFGDLNDVAWSHSSRLFLRKSKLKDPRRGRGHFNTFPSYRRAFFLRFPLDHIFLSSKFKVKNIKTAPSINSDHFPMFIEVTF